ncbi:hypothetical protein ACERK3_05545 [Phycisphaerales bacterium AB-hyl4]|uniref:BioF2-like acetyltransferase domain-containing protein n=1 Tax=Natronomicrosphaera hydrolytica TaxID=3242702 RepID=A0ABV4U2K4_9BACT
MMVPWQAGDWMGAMYARVPPRVIASTDRVLQCGSALARGRMPAVCYEGALAETGERGRVAVVDAQPSVTHFVQRLFAEPVEPTPAGVVTWLRLSEGLDRLADESDLVLARLHGGLGRRRLGDAYLRVPEAVACRAALPAEGALPVRAKRGQARNLRVLRRSGLGWDVSHDACDFVRFYERMYVPFAEHRFGEMAYVRGMQRLRSHFLRGGLIRVMDDGQWVGGVVYGVDSGCLRVWVVGLAEGDTALLERGVMTANWAFAFERAQQLGLTSCHMGLSRPTLNDGVLVYKKRWGAALGDRQPTHCDLFARWDRFNATVRRWLQVSPMLFHDDGRLSGLTGVDEPTECEGLERLAVELAMPGMRRLCVVSPGVERAQRCEMRDERVRELAVQVVPAGSSAELVTLLGTAGGE